MSVPLISTVTRRRATAVSFGGALGLALLAGCGAPAPQTSAVPAVKGPVTLELWDRNDPLYVKFVESWLPTFQSKQPLVKVNFVPTGLSNDDKFITGMASGTPPDVVLMNGRRPRTHFEAGRVMALDAFIKASKLDVADFFQGVYKHLSVGGKQFAISQYVNANHVYYNRDHFRRAGVPFPKDDWTHEDFLEAARRLTRGPLPVREVWGVSMGWGVTSRDVSLLWGECVQMTDPKNPDVFTFNTPQNVKAFQWVHDLPWKYRLGSVTNADHGGVPRADAFFATGAIAMLLEGTQQLATWMDRAQVDWDVAPLPKGPCGRGLHAAIDAYFIPAGVKAPEASWTLIAAYTDKEANRMRGAIAFLPPARKSQWEAWARSIPGHDLRSGIPTDAAQPNPDQVWDPEAWKVLNPIWQALFVRNELSVADALKQAHEAVFKALGPSAVR